MKKFLIIFVVLQLLLFTFIFNSSIYDIYEKNHIQTPGFNGINVEQASGEELGILYEAILTKYPDAELETIKVEETSTEKTVYRLSVQPYDQIAKNNKISASITLSYQPMTKTDFLDGHGIFYTTLPFEKIDEIASESSLVVKPLDEEKISYTGIITLNIYNFLILLLVLLLTYSIYTSCSFKKIGIKQSLGFSGLRSIKENIIYLIKIFTSVAAIILLLLICVHIAESKFSFFYIAMLIIYFAAIMTINILCMLCTSLLTKFVKTENMIKNHTFNKNTNTVAQIIKIVFSVLISVSLVQFFNSYNDYKTAQENILNYKDFNGFYTANGFYSNEYDYLLNNPDELKTTSNSVKNFISNRKYYLCDNTNLIFEYNEGSFNTNSNETFFDDSSAEENFTDYNYFDYDDIYRSKIIISNADYLMTFSDIPENILNNINASNKGICLVPQRYKADPYLKEYLAEEYNFFLTYDNLYDVESEAQYSDIDILYIDDSTNIKVNMPFGLSSVSDNIIVLDNGSLGVTYYMDQLNSSNLFFECESMESYEAELKKNSLDSLIVPATLLTPYQYDLDNAMFMLKMYIMFVIIFSASLLFILFMSAHLNIMVNKKIYALKILIGFSTGKILKSYINFIIIWIIISLAATLINYRLSVLFLAIITDIFINIILYKSIVTKKMIHIQKGA